MNHPGLCVSFFYHIHYHILLVSQFWQIKLFTQIVKFGLRLGRSLWTIKLCFILWPWRWWSRKSVMLARLVPFEPSKVHQIIIFITNYFYLIVLLGKIAFFMIAVSCFVSKCTSSSTPRLEILMPNVTIQVKLDSEPYFQRYHSKKLRF